MEIFTNLVDGNQA